MNVPTDDEGDKVTDSWEKSKVTEWNQQYGTSETVSNTFFAAGDDKELKDPDGAANSDGQYDKSDVVNLTVGDSFVQILDFLKGYVGLLELANWQNGYENNPPTVKNNFIDRDINRFYVRVTDAAANTDPTTKQSVTVQISTDSPVLLYDVNPGADYDDNATTIDFIETDVNRSSREAAPCRRRWGTVDSACRG